MSKEPWNEEVYTSQSASRKDRIKNGVASTRIFTVLAIIFFIIMLVVLVIAIYLSTGGSSTNSKQEFYNASNASSAVSSSSTTSVFAPFLITSGTNLCPSTTAPRMQINREFSSTFRESYTTVETSCSVLP